MHITTVGAHQCAASHEGGARAYHTQSTHTASVPRDRGRPLMRRLSCWRGSSYHTVCGRQTHPIPHWACNTADCAGGASRHASATHTIAASQQRRCEHARSATTESHAAAGPPSRSVRVVRVGRLLGRRTARLGARAARLALARKEFLAHSRPRYFCSAPSESPRHQTTILRSAHLPSPQRCPADTSTKQSTPTSPPLLSVVHPAAHCAVNAW